MISSREPAIIWATIAAVVQVAVIFIFHLTIDQQGVVNAVAVAIGGLITAISVRSDQLAPAILGVAQAVIALALAFHLKLSPGEQAAIMSVVTTFVGMFVRTQVTAPVGPVVSGSPHHALN